ncbi:membrane protein insertion efficiency factor YidD [Henriciella marina]|uniref:membrane protein insertion efficiency factor YidD n=1 Tax=Henriciella marina TaxID=453851 RepID=UPI00036ECF25
MINSIETRQIVIDGRSYNIAAECMLVPSTIRALGGKPELDKRVDELKMPRKPHWLKIVICFLRTYRAVRPTTVGNRCVFEPSCSRYSELAFRQKGFWTGISFTLKRLRRCKSGNGGQDTNQLEI